MQRASSSARPPGTTGARLSPARSGAGALAHRRLGVQAISEQRKRRFAVL